MEKFTATKAWKYFVGRQKANNSSFFFVKERHAANLTAPVFIELPRELW